MKWIPATACLTVALATACSTSSPTDEPGVTQRGRNTVRYDGTSLDATVRTSHASRNLGDQWLVIDTSFLGLRGVVVLERQAISVKAPSGVRIPLISNQEFRAAIHQFRSAIHFSEPTISDPWGDPTASPRCDRWFFENPGVTTLSYDVVYLRTMQECTGPLVFMVPGGVQPGRWVLTIDLEEEDIRIPFTLEDQIDR